MANNYSLKKTLAKVNSLVSSFTNSTIVSIYFTIQPMIDCKITTLIFSILEQKVSIVRHAEVLESQDTLQGMFWVSWKYLVGISYNLVNVLVFVGIEKELL